jgi:hypothetical protein
MKTKIIGNLTAGLLLAFMIVLPVRAQMPATAIRATIPFDFSVRDEILPAGTYEIKRLSEQANTLLIRNINDSHQQEVFLTQSTEAVDVSSDTELIFQRYGDRYFLSKLLRAGRQIDQEVVPSNAERQLRREMVRNVSEPSNASVVVN